MFPLHFAEHSSRDIEEEKDDDEDDDGTAHGSNVAISSLFTNFGRVHCATETPRTVERSDCKTSAAPQERWRLMVLTTGSGLPTSFDRERKSRMNPRHPSSVFYG